MTPELFEQQMRQQGYEIAIVERPAHGSLDLHTHPFEARALILEGEITIVAEGKTQFCRAGELFQLDADVPHTETYGPEGVKYIAARKNV